MTTETTRTLTLFGVHSTYKVTIPESYKVTLGPLIPGNKGGFQFDAKMGTGAVLRIYKTPAQQYAAIPGIVGFIDTALDILATEIVHNPYDAISDSEWTKLTTGILEI